MHVLALDSTTRAGSVAIVDDDRVLLERTGNAALTHAERLPAELLDVLADAGLSLSRVELFAIAAGPGSFTGLRVGIATIQGLAFARRGRVAPISALDALAQLASRDRSEGTILGVWMDAHRREVFGALYRVGSGPIFSEARLDPIEAASVGAPAAVFERWCRAGWRPAAVVGDGAVLYEPLVGGRSQVLPPPPIAGAIGAMAARRARQNQTLDPAAVQPLYIRRPDAEVARERSASTPDHLSRG
jgi:tRNA threonylcarbamoyladenosine biosynthesis protein TsaB